jgi:hypothetical protein
MTFFSKTAIVYNEPNKILGLPPYYYRKRNCDTNLTSSTPANQYQIQKQIQNTVRVYASLYTANKAPLVAYQQPSSVTQGVCWNQMSDRPLPSVQKSLVPTGYHTSMNSPMIKAVNGYNHTLNAVCRGSKTSSKPGSQTPGGIGCDIKHNSYDRYLNRLKGKAPLRRGIIPPGYGAPIPFNPAVPVYGGKVVKTNIISGCNCPISGDLRADIRVYYNPLWQPDPSVNYSFSVGQYVYARETGNDYLTRALVVSVVDGVYTIEFDNGNTQTATINQLYIYYPCNCGGTIQGTTYPTGFLALTGDGSTSCVYPNLSENFNVFTNN